MLLFFCSLILHSWQAVTGELVELFNGKSPFDHLALREAQGERIRFSVLEDGFYEGYSIWKML